ncbi:cation diffusion facilitator family transporter [Heyndrickxia coagulans]|jgi:cobalt-zinc-cadmium efflux system protein|uniref:cation diffusion facilitator family transporter n=2 Tax=Bacillales TaxID=1385 RepID=UPI0004708B63|nr:MULTISPECIES: cation diffusion facilitator family transporter [Heyndrickxia]MEC5270262.1 cation diffusion facilitator family transporter [Heyndrickxia coagulans]MED4406987.1 cation diffusion facilitator family transporter [Heyndrickxia coagulans]
MAHTNSHNHSHDHSNIFHSHAPSGKMKQAFFLAMIILVAEIVFGIISNSLALLADAWHMATDVAAIGLSWFALEQSKKSPNKKMTFGYERAGIIAAAINGLTLVLVTFWIFYSAIGRVINPEPVGSWGMFIGAGIGLVVNIFIIFRLKGDEENLNVKAALLHVIGDVGASAGVIIAGVIIYFTNWQIVDPILSVFIAILVAFSAWNIIKQSFRILMQATPQNIDLNALSEKIRSVNGVKSVHDLHVWAQTTGQNFLTCHAVLNENIKLSESRSILEKINEQLKMQGIQHSTIQIEDPNIPHEDTLICAEIQHSHDHEHDHSREHHHNH